MSLAVPVRKESSRYRPAAGAEAFLAVALAEWALVERGLAVVASPVAAPACAPATLRPASLPSAAR